MRSSVSKSSRQAHNIPHAVSERAQQVANGNLRTARGSFLNGAHVEMRRVHLHGVATMLTIAVVLLVLWLLGLVSSYTVGGLIHILLVAAIVIFLVRAFQGRRPIV
jgi:hypothetical protein